MTFSTQSDTPEYLGIQKFIVEQYKKSGHAQYYTEIDGISVQQCGQPEHGVTYHVILAARNPETSQTIRYQTYLNLLDILDYLLLKQQANESAHLHDTGREY